MTAISPIIPMTTAADQPAADVRATPAADAGIQFAGVCRRFGRRRAVDGVSLTCPPGTFTGLIGLNGAGKSTLMRMAVGLLSPSAGHITVAGHDVQREPVAMKRRVGYVPDRPNIYSWMTGEQAVAFVSAFHPSWDRTRCNTMIKKFRLPMDVKVKHLSKGQAAKLQLLLAVAFDPAVLILDEPTSGFDPIVREEFFEGILELAAERGQTILFSSHAMADVQRLANRVALMHEGRLLLAGTIDEVLDRVKRVRVVLADDTPAPVPPPLPSPATVVRDHRSGREWTLTIDGFGPAVVEAVRAWPGVDRVDVLDVNLDDVFKDVVRGREEGGR